MRVTDYGVFDVCRYCVRAGHMPERGALAAIAAAATSGVAKPDADMLAAFEANRAPRTEGR